MCRCPPGTRGDPTQECLGLACSSASDCPSSLLCSDQQCVDPCVAQPCGVAAECSVSEGQRRCECPKGYEGRPEVACRPVSQACIWDPDCGRGLVCKGARCVDPCGEGAQCGVNAVCSVSESHPIKSLTCSCPPGFTGDPKIQCRKSMIPIHIPFLFSYFIYEIMKYSIAGRLTSPTNNQ